MAPMLTSCEELKHKLADAEFKMLAEVKAETQDGDEQDQLLTERVLEDFIRSFCKNNPEQFNVCFGQIPKNPCEKSQEVKRKISPESTSWCYNERVKKRKAQQTVASASKLIKKKKKTDMNNNKPPPPSSPPLSIPNRPPPMPLEFKTKIESLGGYQVKLVTHKQIFKTDLSLSHDRLSFTVNQVVNKDFLGDEYEEELRNDKVIRVRVIDPRLKEYELGLKRWNSKNSYAYAINRGWNQISADEEDRLNTNDILQVWSFRAKNPNLFNQECVWFALVKLEGQGEKEGDTNSGATSSELNDVQNAIDLSSITMMKDEGGEMMEATESLSMSKKDEQVRKEHSLSNGEEAEKKVFVPESSVVAEKQQPDFGARKSYVMNLKYRNVMIAKIETGVSVV